MKITKSRLRKIIEEEMAHPRHNLGKNIADAEFPIVVGYDLNGRTQSEIAYNQDELDDILDMITGGPGSRANIPYSLDSLADMEPESIPSGKRIERYTESTIKITRRQLRQIIKEEISHMAVPEGGLSVLRAQHTQALSDAIAPLFGEENKAALRDAMMPVLQVAAEDLGGPGEASFHDEARSLVYDAIKVHLQDIVDEVLNAPYDLGETAQWGNFTGRAAPLDVPMQDSGPIPPDQLDRLWNIFIEMGLTPEEILQKPEFEGFQK